MAKYNRFKNDREQYGKCLICLGNIPIEYYFGIGDEIACYECGTTYIIESKNPVKLKMDNDQYGEDDYFGEMIFDEY